ncbi:histidine kinase [Bifidobacterium moukalabense]|uniref:histidine kinase n=1 Tax=Bifidobacterium moukalabense TaxID=1333651 RepID=UPI00201DA206|nr:histidine kinase [Bifidobacterium moukalabense]
MKWKTVALVALGVGSGAEAIWRMLIGEIGIPLGCYVLLATCVAMLMLRFPLRASMATATMWIALCLVTGVVPVGLTALMLVSLTVIAFRRAVVAGVCAMLAMIAWLMMCEGIGFPLIRDADMPFTATSLSSPERSAAKGSGETDDIYGDTMDIGDADVETVTPSGFPWQVMIMVCVLPLGFVIGGYRMRRRYDEQLERIRAEQRKRHVRAARSIHDHVSNDLAYLVLRIDGDIAEGHVPDDAELRELRSVAANALTHTHQVIDLIERGEVSNDSGDTQSHGLKRARSARGGTTLRSKLRSVCERMERRLVRLGCSGRTIVSGEGEASSDDLITGFVEELYGNIIKHAELAQGYVLTIGIEDDAVHIALIDTPAERDAGLAHGSGLARYRRLIEDRGGSMAIAESPEEWALSADIPV